MLGGLFYTASIVGQRLGSEEMFTLREFVQRAVDDARAHAEPRPQARG